MYKYYFFDTLLPPLRVDKKPEMDWAEFCALAKENLSTRDEAQLTELRQWVDLQNLRQLWLGQPIQPFGNLDQEGLETALASGVLCSPLVSDFMTQYRETSERIEHLPELLTGYLEHLRLKGRGFMRWLAEFERQLRLVLVALRAHAQGRDLLEAFRFEDPRDPFAAFLIGQRGNERMQAPLGYEEVQRLWELYSMEPLELAKGLLRFRVVHIEESFRDRRFTVDHILGYAQRLILIQQMALGDPKKAQGVVNRWLRQLPVSSKEN